MSDNDGQRLPTGRLLRMARMARLGLSGASTALTGRDPTALAEQAAAQLADLRGLAAKAGQIGSYLDAVLPKDLPPGVRDALQKLNDATTTSPWSDVQATLRDDLPEVADDLLATLERTPVASGSVAQVHRATHPEVGPVAVKVQHPGVAQVIRADLSQAQVIGGLAGAVVPGVTATMAEVRARFLVTPAYSATTRTDPGWGGLSGWTTATVDLSSRAGQVVHACFVFESDSNATGRGVYVDDLALLDTP